MDLFKGTKIQSCISFGACRHLQTPTLHMLQTKSGSAPANQIPSRAILVDSVWMLIKISRLNEQCGFLR